MPTVGKGLAPGQYCFANPEFPAPGQLAVVRLTIAPNNQVRGEAVGFLSQESDSYHAAYQQLMAGHLTHDQIQLQVKTTLQANRDDIQGYPPQTQETWTIHPTQLSMKIHPLPLKRVECKAIDQTIKQLTPSITGQFPIPTISGG